MDSSAPCLLNTSSDHSCMNCHKRMHSLLDELSYEELEVLNSKRYEVSYKAGEYICKEQMKPSGLICLNHGKVKITKISSTGKEQIVSLKKPVDFIALSSLMLENAFDASAIALEDVSVCFIDKQDFFEIVRKNEKLSFKLMRLLAKELNDKENRLLNLTTKQVRSRLADSLLMVIDIYGMLEDNETVNFPIKRSDLAALSNMTTANAIRVLSSFSKENIIQIDKRELKIKNFKALQNISNLIS